MGGRKLTEKNILEIIALSKINWGRSELARKFHVDHSTIIHHLKKNNVFVSCHLEKKPGEVTPLPMNDPDHWRPVLEQPKSYKYFIQQEIDREIERQARCNHKDFKLIIICRCCGKNFVEGLNQEKEV